MANNGELLKSAAEVLLGRIQILTLKVEAIKVRCGGQVRPNLLMSQFRLDSLESLLNGTVSLERNAPLGGSGLLSCCEEIDRISTLIRCTTYGIFQDDLDRFFEVFPRFCSFCFLACTCNGMSSLLNAVLLEIIEEESKNQQ